MLPAFRFNGAMNDTSRKQTPGFNPHSLWQSLQPYLPAKRWLVGFSGGLDSTALLAALVAAKPRQPIVAIHVNHGLSDNAADWQRHCLTVCRDWEVECRVEVVRVRSSGYGWEDAARNARYQAFQSHMESGDILLLGHHRDDQAETLLFRLMRGAGPRGLGSISAQRPLGPGTLVRPLLTVSKAELETFARSAGLDWISDESNADEAYDRNYLRQQILPLLARRWPNFTERWRLTAEACQQADQLSQDLGRIDLEHCGERCERWGWSVDWECLGRMPTYRRHNLLRTWAARHDLPLMCRKHLREADKQFFAAEVSSQSLLRWANGNLRFHAGRLYLTPDLGQAQDREPLVWSLDRPLSLPEGGWLSAQTGHGGLRVPSGQVEVRWRQGGERCRPDERGHSQSLKKLLQEYGLEPWLRDRIPLIYIDGQLAAVGDLWACKGFKARQDEVGYHLQWQVGGG